VIAKTGFVRTYLDEEVQTTFFIKRHPTPIMEFHDPFANESDDKAVAQLSDSERARFAAYCKYRFGINDISTPALESCKALRPGYLR
jgi:hypothetical protein